MWRPPGEFRSFSPLFAGIIAAGMATVHVVDLVTPLGVCTWVGYIVLVSMTYWAPSRAAPIAVGAAGSLLTIAASFMSPAGAPRDVVTLNRTLGVTALVLTSVLVWLAKRRQEENLRLHDLNRLKTEFLSAFSHEARTPLTAIAGYVGNLLSEVAGPLAPKQRQYIERIARNVERLTGLTTDMLDLSTIEAGNVTVASDQVPVEDLLAEVVEAFELPAAEKGITLQLDVPSPLPPVSGDRDKLLHAMWNLGANAVKFTPRDGRVTFSATCVGAHVRVCVSDTGPGIPHGELDKIFLPFYRSGHTANVYGSGLGLPIAKRLVELNGGRIWAESTPGRGATFCIEVPSHS